MPYPAEHRPHTRERILDSARKLFNRSGFSAISIDDVMAGAGPTSAPAQAADADPRRHDGLVMPPKGRAFGPLV